MKGTLIASIVTGHVDQKVEVTEIWHVNGTYFKLVRMAEALDGKPVNFAPPGDESHEVVLLTKCDTAEYDFHHITTMP